MLLRFAIAFILALVYGGLLVSETGSYIGAVPALLYFGAAALILELCHRRGWLD